VNNISKTGILIFIVLMTSVIVYSIRTAESFGDVYIEQIRIADSDKTLNELTDQESIEIGKDVCNDTKSWLDEKSSLVSIQMILMKNKINIKLEDRILPIIRFQSIYELCPENISILEEIFKKNE